MIEFGYKTKNNKNKCVSLWERRSKSIDLEKDIRKSNDAKVQRNSCFTLLLGTHTLQSKVY